MLDVASQPDPAAGPPPPHPRRWRMPWFNAGMSLLIFIGVLVLMYPSVASWFSQYNQSALIENVVSADIEKGPPSRLEAEIDRAHTYNLALTGGALLSPQSNVPTSDAEDSSDLNYHDLLDINGTGTMGRLKIPGIDVDLPIYHGTSDAVLAHGVGHLQGTSLPVGGASQHSVLTAHRGLPSATLFDNLDKVNVGDRFTVEVFGEVLTYEVISTQVIQPDETQPLLPQYGEDLVTLVTCTPLGINTHRILVTGERVTPTPAADLERAGARPEVPGFPWWAVIIGGSIAALTGFVIYSGRSAAKPGDPAQG